MKIKKLPEEIVYKIRAGEVIEDPSSCVKELIENSIDAGAKRIEIYVEEGGKKLIEIKDDGEGMDKEDLSLCVEPFTSSKIEKIEDLKKIFTFGFRGEALSAIAKVSRLEIKSSINSNFEGYEIYVEGGERKYLKPCAHPKGTTVRVKDLFFSVPARRKFLKSSAHELKKIVQVVTKYALSNPEIKFLLKTEREEVFNLNLVKDFEGRISELFGEDYLKELIKIEKEGKNFSFTLFISRPEFIKENSTKIFFVNKRPFYDNSFIRAFNTIYSEKFKSPDVFLFLFINPEEIDVNVHPQKLEVRFSSKLGFPFRIVNIVKNKLDEKKENKKIELIKALKGDFKKENIIQLEFGEMAKKEEKREFPLYEDLWQFENTYIVVKFEKGLLIIDQHTAHEKIIYERLIKEKNFKTLYLAFPIILKLKPDEFYTFKEIQDSLEKIGFDIRILKEREIQIEGIPELIKRFSREIFFDIIYSLKKERKIDPENIYKEIACKSAIKQGDILKKEDMTGLLIELFALDDPFFCPHGRPVMIQINKDDLDRRFGR